MWRPAGCFRAWWVGGSLFFRKRGSPLEPGKKEVLVMGIGNILLADEGIGPKAVELLEAKGWGAKVDLLDGGTGGFHLLGDLQDYRHLVLIDATLDQNPPGFVRVIRPKFAQDYPPSLSAHDIG